MSHKSVYSIATSEAQAVRIVDNLTAAGFSTNDISVLFPDKGTTHEFSHEKNTKALPAIWSQKAKFDELAQRLQTETAKLGELARAKDEAGVKQQYAAVGKTCGACHENFRQK